MSTSFFEKLTGASSEEEIEVSKTSKEEKPKKKKAKKRTRGKSAPREEDIKKESITMPKAKKTIKKETEETIEKKEPVEEKDWLKETEEGEEGQLTIDVYQTESDIVIKSTIAGVNPEDIDISITNDMVTIKGKRVKDEKVETDNYYYQELYWGAFSRSIILPVEVDTDKAKAIIKNGILTIKLPKSEKIKTKKIRVRTVE